MYTGQALVVRQDAKTQREITEAYEKLREAKKQLDAKQAEAERAIARRKREPNRELAPVADCMAN